MDTSNFSNANLSCPKMLCAGLDHCTTCGNEIKQFFFKFDNRNLDYSGLGNEYFSDNFDSSSDSESEDESIAVLNH